MHLLEIMFFSDEFDILTDATVEFSPLLEEYKILLGIDDIDMVQAYEFIMYSKRNIAVQKTFNEFVKNNLKSQHLFNQKTQDAQRDVLNIYWDYLDKLRHKGDRNICFIIDRIVPHIKEYIKEKQFLFFSKKSIKRSLIKIESAIFDFKDVLPEKNMLKNIANGGIQKALKQNES
jgi:hypothetical protein